MLSTPLWNLRAAPQTVLNQRQCGVQNDNSQCQQRSQSYTSSCRYVYYLAHSMPWAHELHTEYPTSLPGPDSGVPPLGPGVKFMTTLRQLTNCVHCTNHYLHCPGLASSPDGLIKLYAHTLPMHEPLQVPVGIYIHPGTWHPELRTQGLIKTLEHVPAWSFPEKRTLRWLGHIIGPKGISIRGCMLHTLYIWHQYIDCKPTYCFALKDETTYRNVATQVSVSIHGVPDQ